MPADQSSTTEAALEALSARTAALIDAIRISSAPVAVLQQVQELLDEAVELMQPHQRPGPHAQSLLGMSDPALAANIQSDVHAVMPFSALIGRRNPVSPRLEFRADGNRLEGRGSFPVRFVGAPATVHGGFIAAALDEIMGLCTMLNGAGSFTGTLTIRYLRPTPIERELTLIAEVTGREGRKILTRGEVRCDGELTTTAEAVFIVPRAPDDSR